MFLLELLDGLYTLYLIFVAGPRAVWRWIKRLRHPTAAEIAVSTTPEMEGFRRTAWLVGVGWLALCVVVAVGAETAWAGAIVAVLGFMFLPTMVEKRYDRLVDRLSAPGGR